VVASILLISVIASIIRPRKEGVIPTSTDPQGEKMEPDRKHQS